MQANKTYERRNRPMAVGSLLGDVVQSATPGHRLLLAQILPHWKGICPQLCGFAFPESLRGGVLTVTVTASSMHREVQFAAPLIMEGVNMVLGYDAVTSVRTILRRDTTPGTK